MNENTIFNAAVKLPPEKRSDFLAAACPGNRQMQEEVEALLCEHDGVGSFMQSPPVGVCATLDRPSTERPGTLIGRYKLLEQVGEGGMGIVFVAEQTEPVRRRVALKIIKPGMDTKQVIARFEAERQALAMMDHPNIARVLDAGATEAGRPYFVMELVRGMPITEYCDKARLSPRQRLELFVDVCQAVQHAHQKGIIHRDLKPSNVMITLHDGTSVVKVIDFGVAKAVGQQLTERTIYTALTQLVGTPLYMSPEQAEMSGLDVDTRSDVYSLGVLVYELLTGQTPFDKETLNKAGLDEMRRIIREDEPLRPSRRFSTLGAEAISTVSQHRSLDERRLSKILCGELDWIVMKALEKDRSRRYESASAFATDIQRYLSDEPVLACPPTTMYRFQKFARKHKPALATAAVIAASLLLGTTVSAWQAVRATQAEAQANANATQAQQNAQQANTQRDEAQRQRDEVKALSEKLLSSQQDLQRTVYAAHINLAQSAWDVGEVGRVTNLLDQHRPKPGEPDPRGFEWHYLYRLSQAGPLLNFQGPQGSVAFSRDGTRLTSFSPAVVGYNSGVRMSRDAVLRVWNVQTGQELLNSSLKSAGSSPSFSRDRMRLADTSGRWDRTMQAYIAGELRVWDTQTGRELFSRNGAGVSVAFSPDSKRLASTWADHTVKVWDTQTGEELLTLKGHSDWAHDLAFSPDGKLLGSSSNTWDDTKKAYVAGEVKVWDTQTGEELFTLPGQTEWIHDVAFSPDGNLLVSGAGRTLKLWDARTGQAIHTLNVNTDWASELAFSADGTRLASGGYVKEQDERIREFKMWDTRTGQELLSLRSHGSLTFSPNGKRLAATDWAKPRIKVWDAQTGQQILTLQGTSGNPAFSPDSKRLASRSSGGLRIWDLETGEELNTIKGSSGDRILAFSPDGRHLITAGNWGAQLWDAEKEQESQQTFTLKGINRQSALAPGDTPVVFSPDFSRLAGISYKTVKVFDARDGQERFTLQGHSNNVFCVAFSPDGKRLASGDGGRSNSFLSEGKPVPGVVKVWDADSGRELFTLKGHDSVVFQVAFSPDGKRLASVSEDHTVKVWDTQTEQNLVSFTPKEQQIRLSASLAFSPDGKRLVSAGKVWDAQTGQELVTLRGGLSGIVFSPDGKRIVSTSGMVRVFDAETGQQLLVLADNSSYVAFSPDGKRLASARKMWDAQTLQELLSFKGAAGVSGNVA